MDENINREQSEKISELSQDVAVVKVTIDNFAKEFRNDLGEIKKHTEGFSVIKEKVSNLEIWKNWQLGILSGLIIGFIIIFVKIILKH